MAAPVAAVLNISRKALPPEYADLAAWCSHPEHVYIGRGLSAYLADGTKYPPEDSPFCNPFKVSGKLHVANLTDRQQAIVRRIVARRPEEGRDCAVTRYEEYIRARLREEPELVVQLRALQGKRLGCWCKPKACHGDVLVKLLHEELGVPAAEAPEGPEGGETGGAPPKRARRWKQR